MSMNKGKQEGKKMVSDYSVGIGKFKAHFHNGTNNNAAGQDGRYSGVTWKNCKHIEVEIHVDIHGVVGMMHCIRRAKGKEEHTLDGLENGSSFRWSKHRQQQHALGVCLL